MFDKMDDSRLTKVHPIQVRRMALTLKLKWCIDAVDWTRYGEPASTQLKFGGMTTTHNDWGVPTLSVLPWSPPLQNITKELVKFHTDVKTSDAESHPLEKNDRCAIPASNGVSSGKGERQAFSTSNGVPLEKASAKLSRERNDVSHNVPSTNVPNKIKFRLYWIKQYPRWTTTFFTHIYASSTCSSVNLDCQRRQCTSKLSTKP